MPLDVDSLATSGVWIRFGREPEDALPARDPELPVPDNRWQRGSVVDALYLGDERGTALAEWYRYLAEFGVPPAKSLPNFLWRWRVEVTVADLRTEKRLERVGLAAPAPGIETWSPFQEVGETLYSDGFVGLIAPSAARPENFILCLFREHALLPGARPNPPPEEIVEPPAPPTGMRT